VSTAEELLDIGTPENVVCGYEVAESFMHPQHVFVNRHELVVELATMLPLSKQVPPDQPVGFSVPELLRAVAAYHGARL
jgi:hypothetical protein